MAKHVNDGGQGLMRVVIAMSGGVDSSVAAALLVEQGYDVVGIMLKLWSEGEMQQVGTARSTPTYRSNRCCTLEDALLARQVADQLGIPFYLVNVANSFKRLVVEDFIAQYAAGRTPNPCINCNRHVRFEILLNKAIGVGAEKLATGHYARIRPPPSSSLRSGGDGERVENKYQLLRGVDRNKDQSYVLSVLTQDKLSCVMFPLGELTKPQVREIAERKGLAVAEKPESQDLCFLSDGDYRGFLMRNAPDAVRTGPIRDTSGRVVGQHLGLPFYTIGQRKGIGIPGPQALYVIALDVADNALIVGTAGELGRSECTALRVNYVSGERPDSPFRATAKIRYKAREADVTVTPLPHDSAHIYFDEPQRDITPGQGIVFYDGQVVVGGGIIATDEGQTMKVG
jgi:tRNA-specific 2-thiouridylase